MITLSNLISSVEESRTLAITGLIKKLKAEGKPVLSFSAGEPDFPTPKYISDAAIKAIQNNYTKYTNNEGSPELLKAIINKFSKDNNLTYLPENIIVSSGAKHSIYNILLAICNTGDEVIFQAPYWVSYPEMVKMAGAKSVVIDAGVEAEYKITPEQLKNALTPNTKALIFNSPSNPTGAVYSKDEIIALAEVLKGTNVVVISDEIYEKILFDGEEHFSIGSLDYMKDQTVTINGVSKAYSMTGWRLGYAAGPKDIIRLARNLQSHSTSNACSISQAATVAALNEESGEIAEMVKTFSKRRDFICAELNKIKYVKCPVPKGAFYVFFDVSETYGKKAGEIEINDSTSFCNFLLNEGNVGLVPGIAFGSDSCVRMSYACSMEQITAGVAGIKAAIEKLG